MSEQIAAYFCHRCGQEFSPSQVVIGFAGPTHVAVRKDPAGEIRRTIHPVTEVFDTRTLIERIEPG